MLLVTVVIIRGRLEPVMPSSALTQAETYNSQPTQQDAAVTAGEVTSTASAGLYSNLVLGGAYYLCYHLRASVL